jgi:hypothetical protein
LWDEHAAYPAAAGHVTVQVACSPRMHIHRQGLSIGQRSRCLTPLTSLTEVHVESTAKSAKTKFAYRNLTRFHSTVSHYAKLEFFHPRVKHGAKLKKANCGYIGYIVLCQDDSNPPHFKIVERDSHTFMVEVGILPAVFLRRSSSTAIWPS